eukprot:3604906-Rhodomonas_salina.1
MIACAGGEAVVLHLLFACSLPSSRKNHVFSIIFSLDPSFLDKESEGQRTASVSKLHEPENG